MCAFAGFTMTTLSKMYLLLPESIPDLMSSSNWCYLIFVELFARRISFFFIFSLFIPIFFTQSSLVVVVVVVALIVDRFWAKSSLTPRNQNKIFQSFWTTRVQYIVGKFGAFNQRSWVPCSYCLFLYTMIKMSGFIDFGVNLYCFGSSLPKCLLFPSN